MDRPNFYSSPAISRSLDACLQVAGLAKEQIDLFDLYSLVSRVFFKLSCWLKILQSSCFPIVPKLACHHLDLPLTAQSKPITLLGGLVCTPRVLLFLLYGLLNFWSCSHAKSNSELRDTSQSSRQYLDRVMLTPITPQTSFGGPGNNYSLHVGKIHKLW